jgi:serine/threonine protein kinase
MTDPPRATPTVDDSFLVGKQTFCGRFTFSMRECDVLGSGSHGEVFHGFDRHTSNPVAVKVYGRGHKYAAEEAGALKRLSPHPNVLTAIGFTSWMDVHNNRRDVFVSELWDSDLYTVLEAAGAPMTEPCAANVMYQLLQGLGAVHAAGIAHHDVKLENIYCRKNGSIALGDFDLASVAPEPPSIGAFPVVRCVKRGTRVYLPPELRLSRRGDLIKFHPFAGDVWACGVVMATLLTMHGMRLTPNGLVLHSPEELGRVSEAGRQFLAEMLTEDPVLRPSVVSLLDHPWLGTRRVGSFQFISKTAKVDAAAMSRAANSRGCFTVLRLWFHRRRGRIVPLGSRRSVLPPSAIAPLPIQTAVFGPMAPRCNALDGEESSLVSTPLGPMSVGTGSPRRMSVAVSLVPSAVPIPSPDTRSVHTTQLFD